MKTALVVIGIMFLAVLCLELYERQRQKKVNERLGNDL